jgi:hypothetical protein
MIVLFIVDVIINAQVSNTYITIQNDQPQYVVGILAIV